MKNLAQPLLQHIQGVTMTLAACWKITRTDGVMLTFTDAQHDLVVDGLTYHAAIGFDPTAVESNNNMAVDNLEVEGLLDMGFVSASDIAAGVYTSATVELFYVNRLDPGSGVLPMKTGYIGQITWQQGTFKAEVRGLMQPFQQNVLELFTKTCRASFGDSRCKAPALPVTGAITAITNNRIFMDTSRTEADGTFSYGIVTFTSGTCAGLSMEVKTFAGHQAELLLPMPRALAIGDTYTMKPGCDRQFTTCRDRHINAYNFRGEPYVPDPSLSYPV